MSERLEFLDLPRLRSLKLGDHAFNNAVLMELSVLPSLESIVLGNGCFYSAPSFSLDGIDLMELMSKELPKLRSIRMDEMAFSNAVTMDLMRLPSLESVEIGNGCFYSVPSFSLNGIDLIMNNEQISLHYKQLNWETTHLLIVDHLNFDLFLLWNQL